MDHPEYQLMKEEVNRLNAVIFGNPAAGDKGMKQKVDEIHDILTQSKGVIAFFGGVRGIVTFVVVLGASLTIIKNWLAK